MLLWIIAVILVSDCSGCGYPGSPAHCTVTFSSEQLHTGTEATYRCDPGFDLLGPVRRLCYHNGTWIPQGIPVCVFNVAAGKAPMQSSVISKGVPQKAVDGVTSRPFSADTCTQTEVELKPWWYVNLLEPFAIQLVRVDFGRPCCPNKMAASVVVRVGNNRPDISVNPVCNRFTGIIEQGRPLFFPCTSSVSGAFVSIHMESAVPVTLSICETFVYTDQVLPVEQCPTFADASPKAVSTYNGNCYVFYSQQPRTQEGARHFCELQGGNLVHGTSAALQGFLSWELYKRHRKEPGSDYWNGAMRHPDTNEWTWINDQKVTLSFWSVPSTSKNCSRFDGTKGWLWSDTDCDDQLNYICQHKPTSCGKPERPANSTILYRDNDIGSVVDYQCSEGHIVVGSASRTCLSTGFYNGYSPKCAYLECGFPATIANGGYNLVNGTRHYNSFVEYFCQDSYILVGKGLLLCDSDQKWNGPPPVCQPVLCHSPPSVANSNVTLYVNTSFPSTSAEYTCFNGFKLVGDSIIFCDSSGFWNPMPPSCQVDKSKLLPSKALEKQKRNRASIAARLNMGGIIALGIFGGFVFLAVMISIIVIIVRRTSNGRESLDSLSTHESAGSRERLYQQRQQQHCWQGGGGGPPPESAIPHATRAPQADPRRKARSGNPPSSDDVREPLSRPHHHRHHSHHPHRDSDVSLETSESSVSSRWCPKHDNPSGY